MLWVSSILKVKHSDGGSTPRVTAYGMHGLAPSYMTAWGINGIMNMPVPAHDVNMSMKKYVLG